MCVHVCLSNGLLTSCLASILKKTTGESRGFAFVDFASIEDARHVVHYFSEDPLLIHNRKIAIGYSESAKPQAPVRCDWICDAVH
jgi:RNA recognition motif-containing protein